MNTILLYYNVDSDNHYESIMKGSHTSGSSAVVSTVGRENTGWSASLSLPLLPFFPFFPLLFLGYSWIVGVSSYNNIMIIHAHTCCNMLHMDWITQSCTVHVHVVQVCTLHILLNNTLIITNSIVYIDYIPLVTL